MVYRLWEKYWPSDPLNLEYEAGSPFTIFPGTRGAGSELRAELLRSKPPAVTGGLSESK